MMVEGRQFCGLLRFCGRIPAEYTEANENVPGRPTCRPAFHREAQYDALDALKEEHVKTLSEGLEMVRAAHVFR